MRHVYRLFSGLVLLVVFVLSLSFLSANTDPISLRLGSLVTEAYPVGLWIIAAFAVGGSLGLLVGLRLVRSLQSKFGVVTLRRRLEKAEAARDEALARLQKNQTRS